MKNRCTVLGLTKKRAKLWICFKLMCSVKYVQKESIWQEIDLFQLKRFQKDPATVNLSKLARLQKPTPNFELGWNWLILAKKCRKKTQWNKTSVGLSSKLRKTAIGTVNLPKLTCFVKNKQKTSMHCFRWKLYKTASATVTLLEIKLFCEKRTDSIYLTRNRSIWA